MKNRYKDLFSFIRNDLLLKDKAIKPNAGLLYFKLFPCSDPGSEKNKKDKIKFLERLCDIPFDDIAFQKRIEILKKFCNNNYIELESTTPLIIGAGYVNAEESGFYFDRTLGLPYLPGSSVKGTLLSFLEENAITPGPVQGWDHDNYSLIDPDDRWEKKDIIHVFGSQSSQKDTINDKKTGGIIFPGAYPVHFSGFETDIITPHYTDYYTNSGNNPPLDIYSPVPVHFHTIKPGSRFIFLFKIRKEYNHRQMDIINRLKNLICAAGKNYGFGAKTSSGYGYFSGISG